MLFVCVFVHESRVFKSEQELEVIRYANVISSNAHKEVMKNVRPGTYEFQMERYIVVKKNSKIYFVLQIKKYSNCMCPID